MDIYIYIYICIYICKKTHIYMYMVDHLPNMYPKYTYIYISIYIYIYI